HACRIDAETAGHLRRIVGEERRRDAALEEGADEVERVEAPVHHRRDARGHRARGCAARSISSSRSPYVCPPEEISLCAARASLARNASSRSRACVLANASRGVEK